MSKLEEIQNEVIQAKRFVIRKKLLGQGKIISFTNKKGEKWQYDHDKVYELNKERFDNMACFEKYKTYTSTNNIPTFAREAAELVSEAE